MPPASTGCPPPERAALDTLAARAIATGPSPDAAFAYTPPTVLPPPAPPAESVVTTVKKAEVHGDVSLTLGATSHGSSYYGTGMDVSVTDPTGRFTVGVGFETFHGKGLLGLCGPEGIYGPPVRRAALPPDPDGGEAGLERGRQRSVAFGMGTRQRRRECSLGTCFSSWGCARARRRPSSSG